MSEPFTRYLRRFRRIWTLSATVNRLWYGVGVSHQTAALQYRHSPGVIFIEGDQVRPADEFHLVIGEGNDRTKVESTQESNEDLRVFLDFFLSSVDVVCRLLAKIWYWSRADRATRIYSILKYSASSSSQFPLAGGQGFCMDIYIFLYFNRLHYFYLIFKIYIISVKYSFHIDNIRRKLKFKAI